MNRVKAEKERRRREARAGKSPAEIEALDREDALLEQIHALARRIHADRFPEEYDFMMDSICDAERRSRGENPMSADYIARVNAKRRSEGVSPLKPNGLSASLETWELAYREADSRLRR